MMNTENKCDIFRHTYLLLLQMKFCPFVKSVNYLYWKHGSSKFEFYENPGKDGKNYCEHAIVELFYENQTAEILKKYVDVISVTDQEGRENFTSKLFSGVANAKEIWLLDTGQTYA